MLGQRLIWTSAFLGLLGLTTWAPSADDARTDRVLRLFANEFVALTPGQQPHPADFLMGSTEADAPAAEKPARRVTLRRPFAMAKYEVTQELYEVVAGRNPSRWKGPRNSVEVVSWQEAVDFCTRATLEMRRRKLLGEDEVIRLPSEAEWEYACRAGTTTRYSYGGAAELLREYAWFKGNSAGEDPPVGRKKPNDWGLFDMHGYVWEWCRDTWHKDYTGAPADGQAWEDATATERVVRGGSWADLADTARSGYRQKQKADHRDDRIGFRAVRAKEK